MRPLVSILLPCYNAGKYLSFSLESILCQDYYNLEIICINDGSTDKTLSLLESYSTADTRIIIVNQKTNIGLIDSLNNALNHVTGEYFARMDADDYSAPDRISRQVDFITSNSQFDLISTGYNFFIEDQKKLERVPPIGFLPGSLKFMSLFSTPFNHGSVFGKSSLIKKGLYKYDKNFPHSEDFELFSRLAWQGISMANIEESLYWHRLNPFSVSVVYNTIQVNSHLKITRRNLEQFLGIDQLLRDNILKILSNRIDMSVTFAELKTTFAFLDKCLNDSKINTAYSEKEKTEIKKYMDLHIVNIIVQSNKLGFKLRGKKNTAFFIRSLALLRLRFSPIIFRKMYNYVRFRIT